MVVILSALVLILLALNVAQYVVNERRRDKDRAEAASREISLLNRIQAPEVEVARTLDPGEEQIKQFTMYDDDSDFEAALKELDG